MNRRKLCQLGPYGGKVTADMKLPILGVTSAFMLRYGEDRFRQFSAVLLENRGYRKDIVFFLRKAEGFLV